MVCLSQPLVVGMWFAASVSSSPTEKISNSTYPLPIPCTGEACTQWNAALQDANVIQHQNGTFFRISKDSGNGTGLVLSSAPAIAGPWTLRTPVLGPSVPLLGVGHVETRNSTQLWSPELHYINGVYYCYYSLYDPEVKPGFDIRVATSPNMDDNTWTDHGSIGIPLAVPSTLVYSTIDANILANYGMNPYGEGPAHHIVFGSYGSGTYGMQLESDNPLSVNISSPVLEMIQDQRTPVPPGQLFGKNRTEASFHMRMNGWVYYFYSRGFCCGGDEKYAYRTEVCRSKVATGPYVDRNGLNCAGNTNGTTNKSGTLLMESHAVTANGLYQVMAPGSVGIVKTTQGPVLTYQYINQSDFHSAVPFAFNFGHNWLAFDATGWPYLSDTPQKIS